MHAHLSGAAAHCRHQGQSLKSGLEACPQHCPTSRTPAGGIVASSRLGIPEGWPVLHLLKETMWGPFLRVLELQQPPCMRTIPDPVGHVGTQAQRPLLQAATADAPQSNLASSQASAHSCV